MIAHVDQHDQSPAVLVVQFVAESRFANREFANCEFANLFFDLDELQFS